MADKTSWTGLLADLIRGFVLLRDLFGYVLPGVVFLLVGVHSGHVPGFEEFCKICGLELPKWMAGFLLLVVSYVTGHFLVATVFFIPDLMGLIRKRISKGKTVQESDAQGQEASDLLRYRKEFPDIFIELDRRSILAVLRVGLAGSALLGFAVFYWLYPYRRSLLVAAGVIMLFSAYGANRHIKEMRRVTLRAARDAEKRRSSES